MRLGKEHSSNSTSLSVAQAAFLSEKTQRCIIADTCNLLTFNYMIARFMFTLLIRTFASIASTFLNLVITCFFFKLNTLILHGFGLSCMRRK